ncbi:MAG TPA: glutathione S-transferase family protein [Candidatus Binataceae bacterium]|nr:glutathione S-transferase family protein [Candidatus Binataceae bacterium]
MKLYEYTQAPNPRRVRVFLAEKGIKVPYEQVDIGTGKNRAPEFLKINPMGGLPVLELDDGTHLAESVAICRYFEALHPEPRLMGIDGKDAATVEMWNRRMEFEILSMTAGAFRNTTAFFKGKIPQSAEYGAICKDAAIKRLEWLDTVLADRPYIAGERFTIADITAMIGIDFGKLSDIRILPEQKNLARWHQSVSSRPSAKA